MVLGHEKLDVYRLSIGYVAWVYKKCATLSKKSWDFTEAQNSIPIPIPIAISIRYSPQRGAGVDGEDHAATQLIDSQNINNI